ncbi:monooxygenase 1-like [Camellia sinensis]|nr:monooxygenase 1-like [Camellia sinensis]
MARSLSLRLTDSGVTPSMADNGISSLFAMEGDPMSLEDKVVIGCDGVNSMIANFIGLKPPNQSTMGGARGFTNYKNGHGFSLEFVTNNKGHVMLGRFPLDHNLVSWLVARPITPQDLTMSKDKTKIISSALESVKGFPREMLEMIQNCDVDSLTFNGTQYRAPWELLNARFRKGTVMVIGDAMHVMGPFLGQGGSITLEDAIVLARCLATHKRAEVALDQYIGERRMRLVQISTKTYAVGTLLETSSVVVKLLCIVLMVIFFRERLSHTRYDCGHL